LIHDTLDDGALPEHDLVEERGQPVLHPSLELGDELDAFVVERLEEQLT
jgi:hypothetical protein